MTALITVVAVALAIVAGLVVAVIVFGLIAAAAGPTPAERVARQQRLMERSLDQEYRSARRAMNDAAHQSWRNLLD
ncbi:hypothetical protein [Curtobacterium sp. MCBD17_019]|uniref:hypothetical protein n=1 Tax=Curtobacterium sp. MCBD17_019 TaxID=2175669 RepID=UPI0011B6AC8D|nr:hypothetical protein [Curtobacterium sp. MCBD17_019]